LTRSQYTDRKASTPIKQDGFNVVAILIRPLQESTIVFAGIVYARGSLFYIAYRLTENLHRLNNKNAKSKHLHRLNEFHTGNMHQP